MKIKRVSSKKWFKILSVMVILLVVVFALLFYQFKFKYVLMGFDSKVKENQIFNMPFNVKISPIVHQAGEIGIQWDVSTENADYKFYTAKSSKYGEVRYSSITVNRKGSADSPEVFLEKFKEDVSSYLKESITNELSKVTVQDLLEAKENEGVVIRSDWFHFEGGSIGSDGQGYVLKYNVEAVEDKKE